MKLLALDFDGVICDSAPENAASAWHCCQHLWPLEFSRGEVTQEQITRFCAIRPYMETGYQAILMTRLMASGAPQESFTTQFALRLKEHIAASGLTLTELKQHFGGERDRWVNADLPSWLSYNRLYPNAAETLKALSANKDCKVIILTTKEGRFVSRILDFFHVEFPQENIYGLERIRKKDKELADFLHSGQFDRVCFVEDRLATLERCAAIPELASLELCFAPWGYTTPEQCVSARNNPRIKVLSQVEALTEIF